VPKYLFNVNYSVEGAQGLQKDGGSKRLEAITSAVEGMGGSIESFHYAYGEHDAYLIAEFGSELAPAGLSVVVAAAGGARVQTVPLLTPAQLDEALGLSIEYAPPGS